MRFLLLNYEYPPLGGGGGGATSQIAREMVSQGHEVVVITSAFKDLPRREERGALCIRRVFSLRKYRERCRLFEIVVFSLSSMVHSFFLCLKWRPSITIAFFTIPSGIAAYALKKVFGIPYIVSLRGGDVPGFLPGLLDSYHRLTAPLIRFLWRGARAVVANSESLKNLAKEGFREGRLLTIPNGIDTSFFQRKRNPDDGIFRIITAGRLTPQKGVGSLLEMMSRVKPRMTTPYHLWIAGDGPQRLYLEAMVQHFRLKECVTFLGWLEHFELRDFYARSSLFVLPSMEEGMSNVVLEAMAMSLPILATNVGGIRELVRDGVNGYLVKPGDWSSFEDKWVSMSGNPARISQMSQCSRELSCHYSWTNAANGYLELCENLF